MNNDVFNTSEILYSHFDGCLPITNNYVGLVLKKNLDPNIKTPYIAGIPGGVFSLDGKENGEGKINFDPQSQESFCKVLTSQILGGLDEFSLVPSQKAAQDISLVPRLSFESTQGDQRAGNAVKELAEESGLIAAHLLLFRHYQRSRHGEQNFYIANKFFIYNPVTQVLDYVDDLRKVKTFFSVDPDVSGFEVVHVDDVFNSKKFTVIGSHKKPLQKAIDFNAKHQKQISQKSA